MADQFFRKPRPLRRCIFAEKIIGPEKPKAPDSRSLVEAPAPTDSTQHWHASLKARRTQISLELTFSFLNLLRVFCQFSSRMNKVYLKLSL